MTCKVSIKEPTMIKILHLVCFAGLTVAHNKRDTHSEYYNPRFIVNRFTDTRSYHGFEDSNKREEAVKPTIGGISEAFQQRQQKSLKENDLLDHGIHNCGYGRAKYGCGFGKRDTHSEYYDPRFIVNRFADTISYHGFEDSNNRKQNVKPTIASLYQSFKQRQQKSKSLKENDLIDYGKHSCGYGGAKYGCGFGSGKWEEINSRKTTRK